MSGPRARRRPRKNSCGAIAEAVPRMVPDLLPIRIERFDLRFTWPGGTRWDGAGLLLVSKNPYRRPRPGTNGTRDSLDTHVLSIIAVRAVKPHELVTLHATEATGTSPRVPGLPAFPAPAFPVEDGALVEVAIDGEPAVLDRPLEFTSPPEALRLRMPLAHRRASHLRRPQSQRDRPRTFFPFPAADRAWYHTIRVRAPRGPQR